MKGRFFFCFLLVLQIVSWVSIATRSFPPSDAMSYPGPKEAPAPIYTIGSEKGYVEAEKMKEAAYYEYEYDRRESKIGSRPPRCEHKCYGCSPCEAIQVPSNSRRRRTHLGIQYANYEPESWKCKCGPSFYSP